MSMMLIHMATIGQIEIFLTEGKAGDFGDGSLQTVGGLRDEAEPLLPIRYRIIMPDCTKVQYLGSFILL
jgi:hypothetical protein